MLHIVCLYFRRTEQKLLFVCSAVKQACDTVCCQLGYRGCTCFTGRPWLKCRKVMRLPSIAVCPLQI